jgi:glycosyltransferase involved in cell wall biosynthesis
MITLIVPTRNRAHTLRRVGESFYRQEPVSEIIFVDDGGSDDSASVIADLAARFPQVRTRILHNNRRRGAAFSRIRGFEQATNDLIMFCDDDVFLAPGYAATCLGKLQLSGASIVSGRLVNKRAHESPEEAIAHFRERAVARTPFRRIVCEFKVEAKFDGDIRMPLTHSVILTRKALLQELSYDPFYARGNGYREESDFQMNAFVNGHDILVTNDTYCVELSKQENPSGGQRVSRLSRLYWNVYYTNYFYGKYYARYARRVGLRTPRMAAIAVFAVYQVYALFVRPLQRLADPEFRRSYWAARASA